MLRPQSAHGTHRGSRAGLAQPTRRFCGRDELLLVQGSESTEGRTKRPLRASTGDHVESVGVHHLAVVGVAKLYEGRTRCSRIILGGPHAAERAVAPPPLTDAAVLALQGLIRRPLCAVPGVVSALIYLAIYLSPPCASGGPPPTEGTPVSCAACVCAAGPASRWRARVAARAPPRAARSSAACY